MANLRITNVATIVRPEHMAARIEKMLEQVSRSSVTWA